MRENIKRVVFPKQSNDNLAFQTYADVKSIGTKIMESLLSQTKKIDGIMHFIADDREFRTGFLSDVYGCTGVFSLMNRMKVELPPEYKTDIQNCIISIIDHIEKFGYNMAPYISDEQNKELFPKDYPYIGAMTWVLSLMVSIRRAMEKQLIDLPDKYSEKIIKIIRNIIIKFNDGVIMSGDQPIGWGYTLNCKKPSLFFTYSVLEAYSDFEDNVMLTDDSENVDLELLSAINMNKANSHIEEEWKNSCLSIAELVWQTYKGVLKNDLIDDNFLENINTISKSEILKSSTSNALFNTIYVVFIMIYGYVNVRENSDEADDVILTMNTALQNVQRIFEQLVKANSDFIVDTYNITFKSLHETKGDQYIRVLNPENIMDSTIYPMLVKANNMIAFYISKYPQKQMSTLFNELFDKMNGKDWLWDNKKYDVKNTERYIEAIADFYAYYDEYERVYVERNRNKKDLELAAEKRVAARVEASLREEISKQLYLEHQNELNAIKESFVIENTIKRAIAQSVEDKILQALNDIIKANKDKSIQLTEFENSLNQCIQSLFFSYFDNVIRLNTLTEKDREDRHLKLKSDISNLVELWVRKLENQTDVVSKLLEEV